MTTPQQALRRARDALEIARSGLEWYRDRFPEVVDGSDDEAADQIQVALTTIESTLQQLPHGRPVAWRHSLTHSLHDTEEEVQLADAESWAEPLYLGVPDSLTEEQVQASLVESGCTGDTRLTYESGPYSLTVPTVQAMRLVNAILRRARGEV